MDRCKSDPCLYCSNCNARLNLSVQVKSVTHIPDDKSTILNNLLDKVTTPGESGDSNDHAVFVKKCNKKSVWTEPHIAQNISCVEEKLKMKIPFVKTDADARTHTVMQGFAFNDNSKTFGKYQMAGKKSYGKTTVFRMPGNDKGRSEKDNRNLRSTSFTIMPSRSSRTDSYDREFNYASSYNAANYSAFPNFQAAKGSTDHNVDLHNLESNVSTRGLDTVEVASLYDSSSCESLPSNKITAEHEDTSVKAHPSFSSLGFSVINDESETEGDVQHEETESLGNDNFDFDIPEYRRDLYKDSLTLLLERWFGD